MKSLWRWLIEYWFVIIWSSPFFECSWKSLWIKVNSVSLPITLETGFSLYFTSSLRVLKNWSSWTLFLYESILSTLELLLLSSYAWSFAGIKPWPYWNISLLSGETNSFIKTSSFFRSLISARICYSISFIIIFNALSLSSPWEFSSISLINSETEPLH